MPAGRSGGRRSRREVVTPEERAARITASALSPALAAQITDTEVIVAAGVVCTPEDEAVLAAWVLAHPEHAEGPAPGTPPEAPAVGGRNAGGLTSLGLKPWDGKLELNLDSWKGGAIPVPKYMTAEILGAMPRRAYLAYMACCNATDTDGTFYHSGASIAKALNATHPSAGTRALALLVKVGLVLQTHPGRRGIAATYRLAPLKGIDAIAICRAFAIHSDEAGQKVAEVANKLKTA